jgi:hypothetical protein
MEMSSSFWFRVNNFLQSFGVSQFEDGIPGVYPLGCRAKCLLWVIRGHHSGDGVGPLLPHKQKRFTTRPEPACNIRARHIARGRF